MATWRSARSGRAISAIVSTLFAATGVMAGVVLTVATPAHAAVYCGQEETTPGHTYNHFINPNGYWDVATNWSAGVLPQSQFGPEVCIPGGAIARVRSGTTHLISGVGGYVSALRIEGTVIIESGGEVSVAGAIYGGSNMVNGGVIKVTSSSTLAMNSDQNGAPAFQNVIGGSLIDVDPGSKVRQQRAFTNFGTIDLTGGGQWVLENSSAAYSNGNSSGAVIGGQLTLSAGVVHFGGTGAVSVRGTGGSVDGTIGPNQSLELGCAASVGSVDLSNGLVNNGSIHFLPPLDDSDCTFTYTLPAGKTLTNNATLTFGNPGYTTYPPEYAWYPVYAANGYNGGGAIVNNPSGTITVYDAWSALETIDNKGTVVSEPGGYISSVYYKFTNSGTLVNRGRSCALGEFVNTGTFEFERDCEFSRVASTVGGVLRPHWVNGTLAKLVLLTNWSLTGTVDVVVDGTPPAAGATAQLLTGPVTGTFGAVTSGSGQTFTAAYPQGGGVQLVAGAPGNGTGNAISAIVPARLLDTRAQGSTVDGIGQGAGVRPGGSTTEVQVIGRAGVPAGATTAILNLTVTGAQEPGFVTAWPCGADRPNASNLNFGTGSTVANGVISKIGVDGKVCLYTSSATHLLADIGGYFTSSSPFRPVLPARLLDTRSGGQTIDAVGQGGGAVAPGSITEVQVTGRAGVPADATAAVLNVTVTQAQAPGFVTAFPCGSTPPTASNLNFVQGSTVPNNVVAKIGTGGKVCLFAAEGTHLLVDVTGYFGPGAAFQAISPKRMLDTRAGGTTIDGAGQGGGPAVGGAVTEVQITGRAGVPSNAVAAVLNVTVTATSDAGYVTAFPCGTTPPTASNINFGTGATVPNGLIVKIGAGGKVCLFASTGTHLIADVSGYFTT